MKRFGMVALRLSLLLVLLPAFVIGCGKKDPNENAGGNDVLESHEIHQPIALDSIHYSDTLYVPIYSDIYLNAANSKSLLAATLSIRNTSLYDSLFVSTIDYYDTAGELVRKYLEKPILLTPMQSVDYVIERDDAAGGSGANFILTLSSNSKNINPVVQAVMIGSDGNKSFAFVTDSYSISRN
jgi:hypothetical protein